MHRTPCFATPLLLPLLLLVGACDAPVSDAREKLLLFHIEALEQKQAELVQAELLDAAQAAQAAEAADSLETWPAEPTAPTLFDGPCTVVDAGPEGWPVHELTTYHYFPSGRPCDAKTVVPGGALVSRVEWEWDDEDRLLREDRWLEEGKAPWQTRLVERYELGSWESTASDFDGDDVQEALTVATADADGQVFYVERDDDGDGVMESTVLFEYSPLGDTVLEKPVGGVPTRRVITQHDPSRATVSIDRGDDGPIDGWEERGFHPNGELAWRVAWSAPVAESHQAAVELFTRAGVRLAHAEAELADAPTVTIDAEGAQLNGVSFLTATGELLPAFEAGLDDAGNLGWIVLDADLDGTTDQRLEFGYACDAD